MTMPVPDDLDLRYISMRGMVALQRLQNSVVEEFIVAFRVPRSLLPTNPDIKRLSRPWISIGFAICFWSVVVGQNQCKMDV